MSKKITLLVADDHIFFLEGISQMLQGVGEIQAIATASTPNEVEELSESIKPDVVVLDMSWYQNARLGIFLLKKIRSVSPNSKIIAFSNYPEMLVQATDEGVDKALSKGASYNEIVETIVGMGQGDATRSIIIQGDIKMSRDQYNVGQAGSVGPESKAENMTFNQIQLNRQNSIEAHKLGAELSQLREALATSAKSSEQYVEIGVIAEAETAAREGDKTKAFERLKKVGKWSLDTATAIGTRVAAEAIKISLGM